METFVHELQSATDFVRQLFADRQINLDYSLQSVGHLDELFEHEFKQGEPTNPDGTFAQYQGLIMTGVSGYIAQVILRNASNAQLSFEEGDENWHVNFSLDAGNKEKFIPGHQVLKKAYYGEQQELYSYVQEAINYFKSPDASNHCGTVSKLFFENNKSSTAKDKQWWKLWRFF